MRFGPRLLAKLGVYRRLFPLERIRYGRVLLDVGALPIHTDQCCALYRVELTGEEPLTRPLTAPGPGSRIAAGAASEPGGLGSREGSGAGGSATLGSFKRHR
jgi:hypothetical protein